MTASQIVMLSTAIIWIIFDIYIIIKNGKKASISANVIRAVRNNKKICFIMFGIGVVCGHLFWSMDNRDWMLPGQFKEYCKEAIK